MPCSGLVFESTPFPLLRSSDSVQALGESPAMVYQVEPGLMQVLIFLALVLVNLVLIVYLGEKIYGWIKSRQRLKKLVNDHPEMQGVHPDEESLFFFESDDSLKALVLSNDQPGTSEPFYASEDDLDQDD